MSSVQFVIFHKCLFALTSIFVNRVWILETWTVRCCINFHFKNFQLAANPTNHQQFEKCWNTRYVCNCLSFLFRCFHLLHIHIMVNVNVNIMRSFWIFCVFVEKFQAWCECMLALALVLVSVNKTSKYKIANNTNIMNVEHVALL